MLTGSHCMYCIAVLPCTSMSCCLSTASSPLPPVHVYCQPASSSLHSPAHACVSLACVALVLLLPCPFHSCTHSAASAGLIAASDQCCIWPDFASGKIDPRIPCMCMLAACLPAHTHVSFQYPTVPTAILAGERRGEAAGGRLRDEQGTRPRDKQVRFVCAWAARPGERRPGPRSGALGFGGVAPPSATWFYLGVRFLAGLRRAWLRAAAVRARQDRHAKGPHRVALEVPAAGLGACCGRETEGR